MSIYFRIDPSKIGKGFITHDDQQKSALSFSIKNDIVEINGSAVEAAAWAARVAATELDEKTALETIEQLEETSLLAEKTELTNKLSEVQGKIDVITAAKVAKQV
ncbi:MAG: hypothetical protein PHD05_00525 [Sphaerochaetaceae bacterium]|nr:hypothetical protein [Sphaerochaetaceae bacterium]